MNISLDQSNQDRAKREFSGAKEVLIQAEKMLELHFWDAAISRGYYAIFHAARASLYSKGSDPITHRGVATEFGRLFVKANLVEEKFHTILHKAREERQVADYGSREKELLPTEGLAREIVDEAKQFVEKIGELLDIDPDKP